MSGRPRKAPGSRASPRAAVLRRQLGRAAVRCPSGLGDRVGTTSRSNFSDVSPAAAPISCDHNSAIAYDVNSAVNRSASRRRRKQYGVQFNWYAFQGYVHQAVANRRSRLGTPRSR